MQPDKSMCPLVIRLFGPLDVRLKGAPLPYLRTRKRQWLLALLSLRHDRQVDRDWLAGTLWPESPASQALYNLRRCLSDLRSALGAEGERLSATAARSICLSLKEATTDVSAFDAAIARGDVSSLEEAVALYRGPLLEGCTLEWILTERQEREMAYLAALETLAAQAMVRQDPAAAARYLRSVIATDPLREAAQRLLMQALAAAGDMAAATLVYREYRLYLHRTLNTEPAPETVALFQQIRRQAQSGYQKETPSPSLIGRLPLPLTGFVGREQELAEITRLFASARLVTLMGPGGMGKTRLAVQLARQLAGKYPDGAWFVDLTGLSDAAQMPQAIASVLGVREERERPLIEVVGDYLNGKQMLLVLDNFEHLVEGGAAIVRRLLERTPGLTCLVTSRQRLGAEGEHEFVVAPLPTPSLPGTPERLLEFESVQLFVERAQSVRPAFQLTGANATAVAAICDRLEGIPLALELAAARIAVLTPEQMLAQLERRLDFLRSRRRDIAERHRTLRAAIEASYLRLPRPLQQFFARLSVFRGGWTLEAAEKVCEEPEALDYLEALREASLVIVEVEMDSTEIRFRLLETLREYAEEKLKPEWAAGLRDRHLDYFLTLAEGTQEAYYSAEQARCLLRLKQEHDNLRAALQHCLEEEGRDAVKGSRLVAGLVPLWRVRGYWREGRAWCQRVLGQLGAQERTMWRAKALFAAACLESDQGDYEAAQTHYEEVRAIGREVGDPLIVAGSLCQLGGIAHSRGDWKTAEALLTESLQIYRELGSKPGVGHVLFKLGSILSDRGELEQAQSLYEESLAIDREIGDRAGEAASLNDLGNLACYQGRLEQAKSLYEQSLDLQRDLEEKRGIANSLGNLGIVAMGLQDVAAARAYFEESLALQRELGDRLGLAITLVNLGGLVCEQADYPAARDYLVECLALCQKLDAKRVAAYALEAFAVAALAQGQANHAARLWAAAHALREAISCPLPPQDQEKLDRQMAGLRPALNEEAFTDAWTEGLAMTFDQAVATALAGESACSRETIHTPEPSVRPASG